MTHGSVPAISRLNYLPQAIKMGGQGILSEYFFEGTEKLLELWFDCSRGDDRADLRTIDR